MLMEFIKSNSFSSQKRHLYLMLLCLFALSLFSLPAQAETTADLEKSEEAGISAKQSVIPASNLGEQINLVDEIEQLKARISDMEKRQTSLDSDKPQTTANETNANADNTLSSKSQEAEMGTILGKKGSAWSLGGYGEFLVTTKFYGPDPNKEYSPADYHQTDVDIARLVFFAGYEFTHWLSFQTEIEFEHGGTGSTMEVEWDEFGEYETEVEKGGEIVLEQVYLEFKLGKEFNLPLEFGFRFGHLLVPIGMTSHYHTPNMFSATSRPEAERALIPSTWHETGAEFFLNYKAFSLQLQGITGMDSTGFSSSNWIAGGTQRRFEAVRSNDWGVAIRADYSGIKGLMFGASFYTSNTTQNRPKRDMEGIDARIYLTDFHLRYHYGAFRIAAMGMMGWLTNADKITEKNSSLSKFLEVPRTPVASAVYSYYFETSLDLIRLINPTIRHRFDLFLRYDGYDTMWKAPKAGSGFDNPLLQRQVLTAGINYFPHPRVVFKGEYVSRWINKDKNWGRHQHEVNCGLGFVL